MHFISTFAWKAVQNTPNHEWNHTYKYVIGVPAQCSITIELRVAE